MALVREALDLGVNFIDTAEAYGTEEIVGEAIKGRPRDSVIVSTKAPGPRPPASSSPADAMVASLDASLRRLGTDYVDLFHLHGRGAGAIRPRRRRVRAGAAARTAERQACATSAVSETGPRDPGHEMLERALSDEPPFEVVDAGLPHDEPERAPRRPEAHARSRRRHAVHVRRAQHLHQPGLLGRPSPTSPPRAELPAALAAEKNPLGFLIHAAGAESLIDAAYRYARHEPGIDVVLFGTSSADHLRANIASILRPPLPAADVAQLNATFAHLTSVGLDLPGPVK